MANAAPKVALFLAPAALEEVTRDGRIFVDRLKEQFLSRSKSKGESAVKAYFVALESERGIGKALRNFKPDFLHLLGDERFVLTQGKGEIRNISPGSLRKWIAEIGKNPDLIWLHWDYSESFAYSLKGLSPYLVFSRERHSMEEQFSQVQNFYREYQEHQYLPGAVSSSIRSSILPPESPQQQVIQTPLDTPGIPPTDEAAMVQQQLPVEPTAEAESEALAPELASPEASHTRFWWLNAKPKFWNITEMRIGSEEAFTTHSANGRKRRIYEHFHEVQIGDPIIAYATSPQRRAVALLEVVEPLHHQEGLGESIRFKLTSKFPQSVPYRTIINDPRLSQSQPADGNRDTFVRLSKDEFEAILDLAGYSESPLQEADAASSSISSDLPETKTKVHADVYASEDLLGYKLYADTLADIIRDPDTKPPVTIGIMAPWGQGKTSLMRFIWENFGEERDRGAERGERRDRSAGAELREEKSERREKKEGFWGRLMKPFREAGRLRKWLRDPSFAPGHRLVYPRIWFNPWQYQSSEQIWAGMAHAMITQLVQQIPLQRQPEFWLKLQLRRMDLAQIRTDIYRLVLLRGLPFALAVLFFTVGGLVLLLSDEFQEQGIISGLLAGLAALAGLWQTLQTYAKGLGDKLKGYMQEPDYEEKLGLFHQVNEDLKKVFADILEPDKPALIFIDDLDRCTPKKVVEVIEAINLLMNG
ncbi:MAG: P-loop NTPase fold protein, partial [Bacteroidota bacterium]